MTPSPPAARIAPVAAWLVLALAGCGDEGLLDPTQGGIEPRLDSIQSEVFTPICAVDGCHAASGPTLGLDLSPGASYDSLVGVPSVEVPVFLRVEPGRSDRSYLVLKLLGDPRIVEARMPLDQAPLAPEAIAAIRAWIDDGAARGSAP